MVLFVCAILLLVILGLRKNTDEEAFLNKRSTTTINGIFVLLIFLSHSTQYFLSDESILDRTYWHLMWIHNQWVVTTFLAFSGFGVTLKLQSDTSGKYLKKFPANRILKTLVNFDVAIVLYLLLAVIIRKEYDILTIAGSFIGLTSVGNSNWYIFTILILYLITYIAAKIERDNPVRMAVIVTGASVLYIVVAHLVGLPSRFVSTVLAYPMGIWIALNKERLEQFIRQKKALSLAIIVIPLLATFKFRDNDYIMNVSSCFFVLLVVWVMTFFHLESKALYFSGSHVFSIYILERIPMIVLSRIIPMEGVYRYVFVAVSMLVTMVMAWAFGKAIEKLDHLIFK